MTERVRFVFALERSLGVSVLEADELALSRYLASSRFAPTTRFNYHVIMRTWYRWLVETGRRHDDPTQGLGTPRLPRMRPRPAATAHVDAALSKDNLRLRTVMKLLLASRQGWRVHEIANTRGEQFDLTVRTVLVTGKGGVKVETVLDPVVAELAVLFPARGLWFPSPVYPGQPVHYKSVSKTLSRVLRSVGAQVSGHSLRHWLATELIREGVPTRVVQEIMRHASIKTTEGYTEVIEDSRREALTRLPEAPPVELLAALPDY